MLAPRYTRRRVIDRLVETVVAEKTIAGQYLQITARCQRHHRQRQRAGVRRDHQVIAQSAFQAQPGHAECPVLVDLVHIGGVIAGF